MFSLVPAVDKGPRGRKLKHDVIEAVNELIQDISTCYEQIAEQAVEHIHQKFVSLETTLRCVFVFVCLCLCLCVCVYLLLLYSPSSKTFYTCSPKARLICDTERLTWKFLHIYMPRVMLFYFAVNAEISYFWSRVGIDKRYHCPKILFMVD